MSFEYLEHSVSLKGDYKYFIKNFGTSEWEYYANMPETLYTYGFETQTKNESDESDAPRIIMFMIHFIDKKETQMKRRQNNDGVISISPSIKIITVKYKDETVIYHAKVKFLSVTEWLMQKLTDDKIKFMSQTRLGKHYFNVDKLNIEFCNKLEKLK